MKIILMLLTTVIILQETVYSQELINENKQWNVQGCCPSNTKTYKFVDDTIIAAKNYKKLYFSYSEDFNYSESSYIAALREYASKVYIVDNRNAEERLLYNFGLEKGDTIEILNRYLDSLYPLVMCVDSIDSIEINGDHKKQLFFKELKNGNDLAPQYWIEDIGSSYGLINVTTSQVPDHATNLLCVKKNDSLIYNTNDFGGNCYITDLNKKYSDDKQISVYPNPGGGKYTIRLNEQKYKHNPVILQVFNIYGELVLNKIIQPKPVLRLNLREEPNGLYLLKLIYNDSKIITLKFIKNGN